MIVSRPELATLHDLFDRVVDTGNGTTVFVTGEPGIGKSTLVEEFLGRCDQTSDGNVLTGIGRCSDMDGISRGFLPWKEALIELDADRAAGSDPARKQSLKTLIKTLFDESGSDWIQNIPQIGEISAAILDTARAIQRASTVTTSSDGPHEASFRERLLYVVGECAGTWLGAIPVVGGLAEAVFKTSQVLATNRGKLQLNRQEDFFELVMHRLRTLSADRPVVVFLDDLQWADASSLTLFQYLAKNLHDAPYRLLLIGTYRPEDIRQGRRNPHTGDVQRHPLVEKINTLNRYGASTDIMLGRFDRTRMHAYVDARLPGHHLEDGFIDELLRISDGNILFIQELLSNLIEREFITEVDHQWRLVHPVDYSRLPGTIEGVISERYDRVGAALRDLLMVAAVEGEEFALEIVESILQEPRIQLHRQLDALINGHAMVRRSSTTYEKLSHVYEFTHRLVQKYIYYSIDEGYRRDLHRLIAETLRMMLDADQLRPWSSRYGFHLGVGFGILDEDRRVIVDQHSLASVDGGPDRVRELLAIDRELADTQIATYTNAEAVMMCDEVLQLARALGDRRTTMEFLGKKAGVLELTGEWDEADDLQRQRLSLADESGAHDHRADAHLGLARLMRLRGEYENTLAELARAQEIYADLDDQKGLSNTLDTMGDVYFNRGEYARAQEAYRRREQICRHRNDRDGLAGATIDLGSVHFALAEFDQALQCFGIGEEIARERGNRDLLKLAVGNIGNVYSQRGDYDRALESYRQKLQISEEIGDRRGVATSYGYMGVVYKNRGLNEQALECYRRQLQISRHLGDRQSVAIVVGNMGNVYLNQGLFDQALANYEQQRQIADELGDRGSTAFAVGNMGLVFMSLGEYERALQSLQRKLDICRELGDRQGAAFAVGNMGEVYTQRRQYSEALSCFEDALEEHRAIGFRAGPLYWLQGIARVILDVLASEVVVPEYLRNRVPGFDADDVGWRKRLLEQAREIATESIAISEELAKPDTLFTAKLLLARIDAGEGSPDTARARLRRMLQRTNDDVESAEAHYWLWKLALDRDVDHRASAERLFADLLARGPHAEVRRRLEELQSARST